jgi:triosephosphate isomerase
MIKQIIRRIKRNRKREHAEFIWKTISQLRNEIIDDVLIGHSENRMPIKVLKRKAALIKKYSRRLRILRT